ncbi:MAG TPA: peptide-methionine (S)-S-oxide reductase MsrA [Patescibacteria group bacterium]
MNETATFAGGCFWCTEAIFKRLKGVISVLPGYSGGHTKNPTWEEVSSKTTGHAESIQIIFDPKIISFEKLVDIFFHTHDPTTLNQQNYDKGPEYRSAIFYHSENQKKKAEEVKSKLDSSHLFKNPILTEITPFTNFYEAESYHKNFYESGNRPDYCTFVIDPKIQKLLKEYGNDVKDEYK